MEPTSNSLLEAIVSSLRLTAKSYFPGVEEAPAAVLWTDPDSAWQPMISHLRPLLPELLILGDYNTEEHQGPVIWLKTALGGKVAGLDLPEDVPPILYLPGVARHQLRNADQCAWEIQPLVELLYRGVAWTHKNGRDWTVEGFLMAADGLALDVAQDERTRLSISSALGVLGQTPLSRLRGRRLEASDFDSLVIGDTPRDLLTWIGQGDAVRAEWSDERWHAFRSRCRDEFEFDPDQHAPLSAAEWLGRREKACWTMLWERYCEAPAIYSGVRERLEQAQPIDLMTFDVEPWPRENAKLEGKLAASLSALAELATHDARQKLADLEKEHAPRRRWVWAKLGESPLATALKSLHSLGEATRSIPSFSNLNELATWYAETSWMADIAMLDALRLAETVETPVRIAVRSIYLPWLEEVSLRFQQLAHAGYPVDPLIAVAEGECLLFVDGLRLDQARRLADLLAQRNLELDFQTRFSALPTVTATAKPAISPLASTLSGGPIPADFAPNTADGKPMTSLRFVKLLGEASVEKIDEASPVPIHPNSRGWCETGRIDSRGHDLGVELANHLPAELNRIVATVERLVGAGWRSVKIVTDHGWLLMPGGLEKFDLPGFLVESRWSRCASIKGESKPSAPLFPWRWNGTQHVAVAPGAKSFLAGMDYAHGGVSPQECVLPVITVTPMGGSAGNSRPSISSVIWKRQRCSIDVANPLPGLIADLRLRVGDPSSSVAASPKEVEPDGQVSLLVTDETLEGNTITVVLLSSSKEPIAKAESRVGG